MSDLKTVEKILRLIRLLNTPPAKTADQLRRRLGAETSQSAIYRYIKLLKKIGYPVETDEQHRKYIAFSAAPGKGVLVAEELDYIIDTLQKTAVDDQMKTAILHKLNRNLSLIPLADVLPQLHISKMLELTNIAIAQGWCMIIKDYHSISSNSVRDRHVEPLEITRDNRYLIAWDLDIDRQGQFKIERIASIELLEKEPVSGQRMATPMDFFGLTGTEWKQVRIKLGNMAHHLLSEEFPLTRPHIRKIKDAYYFDGPVLSWKGIGRFVLGLPGELEVIAPEEFKEYLREKLKNSTL